MPIKFVVLLVLTFAQVYAADKLRPASLRGLKSVQVLVENLSQAATSAGLTQELIKTDVELRLRRSKIIVNDDASAYLYILISAAPTAFVNGRLTGSSFGCIDVSLNQTVFLERDQSLGQIFGAATWHTGGFYTSPTNLLVESIRRQLADYIDEYINDYLSVNPLK